MPLAYRRLRRAKQAKKRLGFARLGRSAAHFSRNFTALLLESGQQLIISGL
jgi:hypothetical protein